MRLAIIAPADVTLVTGIRGAIMRQFYDRFMKNARTKIAFVILFLG